MKLSVLKQKVKRSKNITTCFLTVALNDNGKIVKHSIKTFVGKAKCHDEPYDFKTGKRIALARAELKAYNYFDKAFIKINEYANKVIEDSNNFRNKLSKQYFHNIQYIKDIVAGSNN